MSFEFLNQGQSSDIQVVTPEATFIDPVSKIRVSNPSNLIDTDFEYGLQPTKWETVEIINNTPAFFSKSGDTTIPDITGITTNAGTREITVTTAFPHDLAVGIPIRVDGTKSITADGSYIINATPSLTTFTYLCRANQPETISIFDLYTSIITGEFFQGSQISIDDAEGIVTDAAGPISTLTVKTKNKHGFGLNTPFYFLNLNSTISQEFDSNNNSSVSFDPTNSATAQTFDGSNTQLKTPIDLSNSATSSLYEASISSSNATDRTFTVTFPQGATEEWLNIKEGDPLYHSINAGSGYFQSSPRGVVFIKAVDLVDATQGTATFQVSSIPGGTPLPLIANITGTFKVANQAVTFPGNNVDASTQIALDVIIEDSFIFDGGNQGYDGEPAEPPNNDATVLGWSGTNISLFTSEGDLDYYEGAMLLYTTDGTPPTGLTNNTTYFVTSFAPGVSAGLYDMSIAEYPGEAAITTNGSTATGSQSFSKIGVSPDKDILHVKDAGFIVGDMVEYIPPGPTDVFTANFQQTYYFIETAYDTSNFKLNDNPFVPITATGGNTVEDVFYDGRTYRVHTFTSTGTSTFEVQNLGSDPEVEFMVVAGGGSGGNYNTTNANGGGGGGGIVYKKKHTLDQTGAIDVTVGAGGARRTYRVRAAGNDGQNSAFGNFVANGGGGGGARYSGGYNSRAGGSGGGVGWENTYYNDMRYNTGVSTQRPIEGAQVFGNNGGDMAVTWTGAGGGGAFFMGRITPVIGGQGSRGGRSAMGGWGGWGQPFDITGRVKFYAGGGGGGANSSERGGDGMHGGGRGFGQTSTYDYNQYDTTSPPTATNGTSGGSLSLDAQANTGGGGGGGSYWENNVSWRYRGSGAGGSGIVVIRYPITPIPDFVPTIATGGDEINDVVDKDGHWRVHKFTSTGTSNFSVTQVGTHGIEFLVIAGGGSGGNGGTTNANGGGGAGGVVHCTSYELQNTGDIPVTVGAGGARIPYRQDNNGNEGQDSYFGNFRARGGGGGGGRGSGGSRNSTPGGSGGGGAEYNNTQGNNNTQPAVTTGDANGPTIGAAGFGNRGAKRWQRWTGGGGGGAGTFGIDGSWQTYPLRAGDGGLGYYSTIEGEPKWYAGGGGGGANSTEKSGDGWHGGGRGFGRTTYWDWNSGFTNQDNGGFQDPRTLGNRGSLDGLPNTGGGGGAGTYWENNASNWRYRGSGAGGSGVVIVRYRLSPPEFFGYDNRLIASGGEENDIVVSDGSTMTLYRTHTFRHESEAAEFTVESLGSLSDQVEYLIVAGGGGGGSDMGGGGGAGGVLQGKTTVTPTTYQIEVGRGGKGHSGSYNNYPDHGENGFNSSFAGQVAIGGGAGSSGHYGNNGDRRVGGSSKEATDGGSGGGGSAAYRSVSLGRPPGKGTPGQGTDGGYGKYTGEYEAGGGGGAGGNPEVNFVTSTRAGNGGPGIISDILGVPYYFGGGGGGAAHDNSNKAGNGGLGGGAPGSRWRQEYEPYRIGFEGYGGINMGEHPHFENGYHRNGANAGENTGGGGGGGLHQGRGGNGGSGIVVIRYPISTPRSIG
jgi:hypothetical protein